MIKELRLLPPLAIGRLGSADAPLAAYELVVPEDDPLGFRRIEPRETLEVDPQSGAITRSAVPDAVEFRDATGAIRPVAPFLELFAIVEGAEDDLVPVTPALLEAAGYKLDSLQWEVAVANNKAWRRTGDPGDRMEAAVTLRDNYWRTPLAGRGAHLRDGCVLPLGHVQLVRPADAHPGIRLRFTPAQGLVYGAHAKRRTDMGVEEDDPVFKAHPERIIYDPGKGRWRGYVDTGVAVTSPGQIFAGSTNEDGLQQSWGYLDDECDGYVKVTLAKDGAPTLETTSHICAGPPTFAPDTLPIRVISDELEQMLLGPSVDSEAVTLKEAQDIVRRSLETIRLLNTAVMNGNPLHGRARVASTMMAQDTNDFGRHFEPIAAASIVDNLALQQLHRRLFAALGSGAAAWFGEALRRPEEIGDLSSNARRKMPAMMRGADGRALTLTRRQIDIVIRAAARAMAAPTAGKEDAHE